MLQILSTSNETATGPELVTDGDFTATGSDLITNGDFSATGSELVVNGDFSGGTFSPWANNPNWSLGGVGAIADGTSDATLWQSGVVEDNKSYKVTYTLSDFTQGSVNVDLGGTDGATRTTAGTYTDYIVSGTSPTTRLTFEGSGSFIVTLSNVSVKELGEDWNSADGNVDTYNENGVTITSITGAWNNRLFQSNVTEDGKSYKVTYTIEAISYTAGTALRYYDGANYVTFSEQGVGTHTFYLTREGTNDNWYFNLDAATSGSTTDFVTISSIIVQELGEDWTQGNGWTIGDSKAISAQGLGGELITNGDFSATGSELAVALTSFTSYTSGTSTVTYDGSIAELNIDALDSLAVIYTPTTILEDGKSYKIVVSMKGSAALTASLAANTNELQRIEFATPVLTTEYQTFTYYFTQTAAGFDYNFAIKRLNSGGGASETIFIQSVSVKELGEDWTLGTGWSIGEDEAIFSGTAFATLSPTSPIIEEEKSYKITFDATVTNGSFKLQNSSTDILISSEGGSFVEYFTAVSTSLTFARAGVGIQNDFTITNISVEEIATSYLAQDGILTVNRTYKFGYTISNYSAGTVSATDYGAVKDEDEVVLDTVKVEGVDFSIKNIDGYFVGDIESVSAKLLGTYLEQSIYVTAADIQTIAQASVYYLVELTSMASKNSLYFLPSSVVANNGRYTKLNFTVISKDATPTPAVGIISFYDSVGGFDTYPMGFYEFKIYEQTSSTNLDPSLATGLLEKGFAFVRDFSGNMQELTDDFNEYNPTLTQYVYSK